MKRTSPRLRRSPVHLRQLLREAITIIDTADGKAIPVVTITAWLKAARIALESK